jgi:alkanesulfonate monooxygenase SsuD/methylene tetrahydromethanopterin reductase-like flavin-dependent oxidoreductase (luciferase family)
VIDLKPVQKPHPPVYLAAFSPGAMKRIATHADGWAPVAWEIDKVTGAMDGIRNMMREAGRNPADLKLVVRGNVQLTPDPLEERYPFVGSWEQILSDIEETRRVGADELFVEPQGASPQEFISLMERVRAAVS